MRTKYFKYIAEGEARKPVLNFLQNGGILQNPEDAYNFLLSKGAIDPNVMSLNEFNSLTMEQKRAIFESPNVRAILENKTPGQEIARIPIDTSIAAAMENVVTTPGSETDCRDEYKRLWKATKEGENFIDPCTGMLIKRLTTTKPIKPKPKKTPPTKTVERTTVTQRVPMTRSQSGGLISSNMNTPSVSDELFANAAFTPETFSPMSTNAPSLGLYDIRNTSSTPMFQNSGSVKEKEDDDDIEDYLEDLDVYVSQFGEEALSEYPEQYQDYLAYKKMKSKKSNMPSAYLEEIIFTKKRLNPETNNTLKSFISQNNSPSYSPYSASLGEDIGEGIINALSKGDFLNMFLNKNSNDISPLLSVISRELTPGFSMKEPMGVFQQGGSVVSPSYSRYLPVGNSKKLTGYIPANSMIPIQTEEGELIVHPTLDITKVNATKRHNKMKSDEVTDVVPEGSYILSRHGVVKIYKDEADKAVIETQNSPYNMYSTNKPPTVKTLGDFMSKKEMSPAEVANNVLKKYKTVDNNDPFTDQTNRSNKYTASKYIKAIIDLSEFDKDRKGMNSGQQMSQMFQGAPDMSLKNGGKAYSKNIKTYQDPATAAAIEAAAGIVGVGANLWSNWQNRRLARQMRERGFQRAKEYEQTAGQLLKNQLIPAFGALAITSPEEDYARSGTQFIEGLMGTVNTRAPERAFASSLAASAPDFSMYDPRVASALIDQEYAKRLQAQSNFNTEMARDRNDRFIKYLTAMQGVQDKNEAARIDALNRMRANRNALISQAGSLGTAYFENLQNILANKQALEMAAETGSMANLAKSNANLAEILSTQLPSTIASIQKAFPQNNPQPTFVPTYTPGWRTPGWGTSPQIGNNTGYRLGDTSTWLNIKK